MCGVLTVRPTNGLSTRTEGQLNSDDPRLLYVDTTRGLSALTRPCMFTAVWEEINLTCGRQRGLIIWLCFITAWLFIDFRDVQINVQKITFILSNVCFFPFLSFFLLNFPRLSFLSLLFVYLFSSHTFLYPIFLTYSLFVRFFITLFLICSLLARFFIPLFLMYSLLVRFFIPLCLIYSLIVIFLSLYFLISSRTFHIS